MKSTQNPSIGNHFYVVFNYKIKTNIISIFSNELFIFHLISRPDTASYIQKLEREREAREKGDVKDNRSFLAKYVSCGTYIQQSDATATISYMFFVSVDVHRTNCHICNDIRSNQP